MAPTIPFYDLGLGLRLRCLSAVAVLLGSLSSARSFHSPRAEPLTQKHLHLRCYIPLARVFLYEGSMLYEGPMAPTIPFCDLGLGLRLRCLSMVAVLLGSLSSARSLHSLRAEPLTQKHLHLRCYISLARMFLYEGSMLYEGPMAMTSAVSIFPLG